MRYQLKRQGVLTMAMCIVCVCYKENDKTVVSVTKRIELVVATEAKNAEIDPVDAYRHLVPLDLLLLFSYTVPSRHHPWPIPRNSHCPIIYDTR